MSGVRASTVVASATSTSTSSPARHTPSGSAPSAAASPSTSVGRTRRAGREVEHDADRPASAAACSTPLRVWNAKGPVAPVPSSTWVGGQGGVPAEVDLDGRREPPQVVRTVGTRPGRRPSPSGAPRPRRPASRTPRAGAVSRTTPAGLPRKAVSVKASTTTMRGGHAQLYACSCDGYTPPRTSSPKRVAASRRMSPTCAYSLTNFAGLPVAEAGEVLPHEHLGVAGRSGADADGGDVERGGQVRRDLRRHDLHDDGEGTGVLQRLRVLQQAVRRLVATALHAVATQRVDRLRGQPDVGHDGDAGGDEGLDLRRDALAALELDRLRAALLHEARRRLQRLRGGGLVRAEGQIGHDERALGATDDAAHQREQLVDADRDGGVVAVDDVGGRVADEQDGDAGLVEHPRGRVVVGREHRPALAAFLRGLQITDGDAAGGDPAVERHGGRCSSRRCSGHGGVASLPPRGRLAGPRARYVDDIIVQRTGG